MSAAPRVHLEADALVRLGLLEGSPNIHAGQGTANRRFFFCNSFLELLWVCDPGEARSEQVARTRLWERWNSRTAGACPFGLVFRPKDNQPAMVPFATWAYHPSYLPAGLAIEFAEGTSLQEPELVYLPFAHRSGPPASEPTAHNIPIRHVCGATITLPANTDLSQSSQLARSAGLVDYRFATEYLLEIGFLAAKEFLFDLRPTLPLLMRAVTDPGGLKSFA